MSRKRHLAYGTITFILFGLGFSNLAACSKKDDTEAETRYERQRVGAPGTAIGDGEIVGTVDGCTIFKLTDPKTGQTLYLTSKSACAVQAAPKQETH